MLFDTVEIPHAQNSSATVTNSTFVHKSSNSTFVEMSSNSTKLLANSTNLMVNSTQDLTIREKKHMEFFNKVQKKAE